MNYQLKQKQRTKREKYKTIQGKLKKMRKNQQLKQKYKAR